MATLKAIGLILLGAATAVVVMPGTKRVQAQEQSASPVCTLPGQVKYSAGALVRHENQVYRCFFVYGEELKPGGVAWIKMEPTFAPKEGR